MGQSRVIWVVMLALLVLIGGIAAAIPKKKGGTGGQGGRAVIVPTADSARTVVVPPCATGVSVTAANASQQESTTGAVRVQVPQGSGERVVVVPRCPPKVGGLLPSAVFVLGPGAKIPAKGDKAARNSVVQDLRSEVIVPANSSAKTIVVPSCSTNVNNGNSVVVGQAGSNIAVAPPC